MKRGTVCDVDLLDAHIPLLTQPSHPPEPIAAQRVKAIFFMLAAGQPQPAPEGTKVRITFNDGRQVAGFASGHRAPRTGSSSSPPTTGRTRRGSSSTAPAVQSLIEG